METMNGICHYVRPNGQRCKAHAITGSASCFFHDPAKAGERAAASKAGGRKHRAATLPATTPDHELETIADVAGLLAATINDVRRGALDPRIANSVGYLSGVLLKAMEQGEVEERLAALEATVNRPQKPLDYAFEIDPEDVLLPAGIGA
jgi:hypothetical protein